MKVTLKELIFDYAGGMRDGHTLKAVIPGGSSVPILLPDQIDIPASFDAVQQAGSLLGSAAIMVMDETTDMVWLAENLLHFYRHESCGKCTPCREGTDWLYRLLHRMMIGEGSAKDIALLQSVAEPDQRQDAVRLRRRGGDAGADHAQVVQARVRGLRQGRHPGAGRLPRRAAGGDALRWPRCSTGSRPRQTIFFLAVTMTVFLALQISAAVMVYAERKVCRVHAAALRPVPGRPQGPAPAGRRHRQADLQGGAEAEGGRHAAVRGGAGHLGDRGVHRVRAGAVRRRRPRSSACCRSRCR